MKFITHKVLWVSVGIMAFVVGLYFLLSRLEIKTSMWENLVAELVGLGLSILVVYLIVERAIEQGQKRYWQPATESALRRLRRAIETWEFFVMGHFSHGWKNEIKEGKETWNAQARQALSHKGKPTSRNDEFREAEVEAKVKIIVYYRMHEAAVRYKNEALDSVKTTGVTSNSSLEDWLAKAMKIAPVLQTDVEACIRTLAYTRDDLKLLLFLDMLHESWLFLLVGIAGFSGGKWQPNETERFREDCVKVLQDSLNLCGIVYSKLQRSRAAIKPEILTFLDQKFPQK